MLESQDERVCLEARRHGIVLVRAFLRAAAIGGASVPPLVLGWPFTAAGTVLLVAAAATAVAAAWRWERTRIVVTTHKLFVVSGTLRRRAAAVRFARVGAVEVEQTLLGRFLGYGTIVAGDLQVEYVPHPRRLYGLVDRLCAS